MNRFEKPYWILIVLPLALAACSGPASPTEAALEPVTYTIEMSEYTFSPDTIQARVGQEVTLELVNSGALEHEVMFGRQVKTTGSRPDGFQQEMFTSMHIEPVTMGGQTDAGEMAHGHGGEHAGFMLSLPAGSEKATLTFQVTEDMLGEWEIGCFSDLGVHYEAGMHGKLIVTR